MATGWPMKTTYANGDVWSASDANDITGTINLLTSSTLSNAAGKNAIINGAFDFWARGTSFTGTSIYTADRWYKNSTSNVTVSQQSPTSLSGFPYCARVQRNSGTTGTTAITFSQSIETRNSIGFVDKPITVSFYARKGSNYSATSSNLVTTVYSGTGVDQNYATSYTGSATVATTTSALTTTWTRYTATGTVASGTNELAVVFSFTPTGTAGTNDYFEVTGVQLEIGSTATTFTKAGGTQQGELAACQRYYVSYTLSAAPAYWLNGVARGAATASCYFPVPVELRIVPTVMDYSGFRIYSFSAGLAYTGGTTTIEAYNNKIIQVNYVHGTNVFTTGTNVLGGLDSTSSYINFSAEL